MVSEGKKLPWWLNVVIGVAIIAAAIFLLVSPDDGNEFLTFAVGFGVFVFFVYNVIKAIQFKNDNRLFIPYLAHGLLDLILFILIISIPSSRPGDLGPEASQLIGIIIACWLIIFGFFEVIRKKSGETDAHFLRNGLLLILSGAVVLFILLLTQLNYVIFIGIVAILIGVVKTVQGFLNKARENDQASGGRPGLF